MTTTSDTIDTATADMYGAMVREEIVDAQERTGSRVACAELVMFASDGTELGRERITTHVNGGL